MCLFDKHDDCCTGVSIPDDFCAGSSMLVCLIVCLVLCLFVCFCLFDKLSGLYNTTVRTALCDLAATNNHLLPLVVCNFLV